MKSEPPPFFAKSTLLPSDDKVGFFSEQYRDGESDSIRRLGFVVLIVVCISGQLLGQENNRPANQLAVRQSSLPKPVERLGSLSEGEETGGRGPTVVSDGLLSNGKPDPGGVSYGSYQMATLRGINDSTVEEFVRRKFPLDFIGLSPGTSEFSKKWLQVVHRNESRFRETEHKFIEETHYSPVAESLKEKLGLDLDARSQALRDVIWSTAVQHGPPADKKHGHAVELLTKALSRWTRTTIARTSDEELIKAIYDERSRKKGNTYVHFPGVRNMQRWTTEPREALRRLALERQSKRNESADALPDVKPLPDAKPLPDVKSLP